MAAVQVEVECHDCDGERYVALDNIVDMMEAVSLKMREADVNARLVDAVLVQLKFYQT